MSHDDRSVRAANRAERRLAAVLAADIAGYSRLMERDEEGTHERLRALLRDVVGPAIDRHRGRLVKTTGDGLLAEFSSAMEAVRCGVAMQQAMAERNRPLPEDRRMSFRVGINLGDILIEDGDVFGEGVNLAARLEGLAETGGILVSHTIHDHVRGKLPYRFDDLGEQSVKNIERPVRVYRIGWDQELLAPIDRPLAARPALPSKASIAVLPFTNMSSDPEQDFFADGLAEDLITDLSKVPGLVVIARNSSFAYKGKAIDVRSVARDLGARYIIEGSVRRSSARLRITAQLIDATDASHLWADRFDRDLADVFQLQDEVVGRIVHALSDVLPAAMPVARRRATNLEAYDLFVQGRVLVTQSAEGNKTARDLLERSVELDPGFADAHAWLSHAYNYAWLYAGEPAEPHRTLARVAAERAVSLDPENADAHWSLGLVRAYDLDLANGIAEFEAALRCNPNHADAWAFMTDLMVFDGRAVEGIDCAKNALRLNPHPPERYYWLLGFAQYASRRYDDAVQTLRHKATYKMGSKRILAASLAQLGRMPEAEAEAREFIAENPAFSSGQWASTQPFRHESDRQHFIDGYTRAGLPR